MFVQQACVLKNGAFCNLATMVWWSTLAKKVGVTNRCGYVRFEFVTRS